MGGRFVRRVRRYQFGVHDLKLVRDVAGKRGVVEGSQDDFVVVKVGGTADITSGRLGSDIRELVAAGLRVVVAHGGGDELTAWRRSRRRPTAWRDGLRVTDDQTRDDAVLVFRGIVAPAIVSALQRAGVSAIGLSGPDGGLVRVRRASPVLGWVGQVRAINTRVLQDLTSAGHVPVVSPLGVDGKGQIYNVNGDDIAAAIARATQAKALVFLTDVDGVCNEAGSVISELDPSTARQLLRSGVVSGGMVPKVRAALGLLSEVQFVCIVNGTRRHALHRALGPSGYGTRMSDIAPL